MILTSSHVMLMKMIISCNIEESEIVEIDVFYDCNNIA